MLERRDSQGRRERSSLPYIEYSSNKVVLGVKLAVLAENDRIRKLHTG